MECHIVTLVFACILFCRPRPVKARFLAAVDKHKNSDAGRPHIFSHSKAEIQLNYIMPQCVYYERLGSFLKTGRDISFIV